MKKNVKKLISTVAIFALLFAVVPFSAARPSDRNVAAVCSDLPDTDMAPWAD